MTEDLFLLPTMDVPLAVEPAQKLVFRPLEQLCKPIQHTWLYVLP